MSDNVRSLKDFLEGQATKIATRRSLEEQARIGRAARERLRYLARRDEEFAEQCAQMRFWRYSCVFELDGFLPWHMSFFTLAAGRNFDTAPKTAAEVAVGIARSRREVGEELTGLERAILEADAQKALVGHVKILSCQEVSILEVIQTFDIRVKPGEDGLLEAGITLLIRHFPSTLESPGAEEKIVRAMLARSEPPQAG